MRLHCRARLSPSAGTPPRCCCRRVADGYYTTTHTSGTDKLEILAGSCWQFLLILVTSFSGGWAS